MAIKVGEAYYEIYPKINERAAAAARRVLGGQLAAEFSKTQASVRTESDRTAQRVISNERSIDSTRNTNYRREVLRNNALNRLLVNHSQGRLKIAKQEEGFLHKLATQFRTVGTLARGIGLGAGLLSGFSLLQGALGGIIAAGPIAAAAVALIPQALVGIGVEAIILKGAFKGVGNAISAAFDPSQAKQFQAALQKLSPAAQQFVLNLRKAAGVLPNIQQTFFSAGSLQEASRQLKPFFKTIRDNFKALVAANGNLFGQLFGSVTDRHGSDSVNTFLGNTARLLKEITPGLRNLSSGFLTFLSDVSKQLSGTRISDTLTSFGVFLSTVNTKNLFAVASAEIRAFGNLFSTLGSIFGGVIKAFGGSDHLGEIFFKNLGAILNQINLFVNSGTGQSFLKDLIGTLNVLSSLANTVIKDGLGFIAGVFSGLYPSIKPFVEVVKKILNDVFTPALAQQLGEIASHLLDIGTNFLEKVEPGIRKVVDFLVAHPGVLEGLAKAIGAIWIALKIKNAASEIAVGINAIKLALDWFAGKGPLLARGGMTVLAEGETAVGAGGFAGAAGVQALIGKIIGAAGLLVAFQAVQGFAKDHGWDANSGAGLIPLGKGSDSNGFKDSPFMHFIGAIRNSLKTLISVDLPALVSAWETVGNSVISAFSGLGGAVAGIFNNVIDTIRNSIQWVLDHSINPLIRGINHIPGVNIPEVVLGGGGGHPNTAGQGSGNLNPNVSGHATGGLIKGPGGPTGDKINAMLSNGEFVVNAKSTKKFRKLLELLNAGRGFASGGIVGSGGSTGSFTTASILTSGAGSAFAKTVQIFVALRKEADNVVLAYKNMVAGVKAELDRSGASTDLYFKRQATQFNTGFALIASKTKTLPLIFTTPTTTQYNLVDQKTKTMWTNIDRSFTVGMAAEKTMVATLPTILTVPVRKTYNQVLTATSSMWNNVGKQFATGIKNVGSLTAQIVKSITPGVQGLVKTYTENVKKVWDAVAKPLNLATLAAVSFSAATVSVGNVTPPPTQTPIFVARGGPINGPGGPREDKIAAWLSNGEFVVNAKQTAKYGTLLDEINSGKDPNVDWHYAAGGPVTHKGAPKLAGGGNLWAPKGTRTGTSWRLIEQFVRMMNGGKSLRVTATTGGGHISNSYHYSGEAVDWAGSSSLMAHVAQQLWAGYSRYFLELIHSPRWFAHNGVKESASQGRHTYGAVYAGHFGHIHTAMTKEGARNAIAAAGGHGPVGGGGGTGPVVVPITDKQTNSQRDAIAKNIPGTTVWDNMMRQILLQNLTKLQAVTVHKANTLNGFGAGFHGVGSSKQISDWIKAADNFTNIPDSWLGWLNFIIQHESGGNPRAINRTDSNAQAGHPSQGLMQTIPSTFAAYHDGAPNDILNPISSIVAGINYIKARYGTIFNTPWARGTGTFYKDGGLVPANKVFDKGGILDPGWNHVYNATGAREKLANITDGQTVNVDLRVRYDSAEAEKMVEAKIEHNNKRLTRVLTSRRGG